jgi:hypothetical protein
MSIAKYYNKFTNAGRGPAPTVAWPLPSGLQPRPMALLAILRGRAPEASLGEGPAWAPARRVPIPSDIESWQTEE